MDHDETFYFPSLNKEEKHYKKHLQKKDRSKFKKTDVKKQEKQPGISPDAAERKGVVISIGSDQILVRWGKDLLATKMKGKLKKNFSLNKNLVAVGDVVALDENLLISHIFPRRTLLQRKENLSRKKNHILAANVDILVVTSSIDEPKIKPALIDRYIISAEHFHIQPIIVINKIDLDREKVYKTFQKIYEDAGYEVFCISAKENIGIDSLQQKLEGHISVFSGQSGVGKTSLINALCQKDFKTQDIVKKTQKGSHTTTHSIMIPLFSGNGAIIDTPGIKSFALAEIHKQEILHHYADLQKYADSCKYSKCTHIHEPDCGVKQAVEEGKVSFVRYESYLKIVIEDDQTKIR